MVAKSVRWPAATHSEKHYKLKTWRVFKMMRKVQRIRKKKAIPHRRREG